MCGRVEGIGINPRATPMRMDRGNFHSVGWRKIKIWNLANWHILSRPIPSRSCLVLFQLLLNKRAEDALNPFPSRILNSLFKCVRVRACLCVWGAHSLNWTWPLLNYNIPIIHLNYWTYFGFRVESWWSKLLTVMTSNCEFVPIHILVVIHSLWLDVRMRWFRMGCYATQTTPEQHPICIWFSI